MSVVKKSLEIDRKVYHKLNRKIHKEKLLVLKIHK